MVEFARAQLSAQVADASSNASEALTIAGISAALMGVAIVGEGQLGQNYWIAVIGLLASTLLFLYAAFSGPEMMLGPQPLAFYESIRNDLFEEQLLSDLGMAFNANARLLRGQATRLLRGVIVMVAMLAYTAVLALSSGHGASTSCTGHEFEHRFRACHQGSAGFHTRWICHVDQESHPGSCRAQRADGDPGACRRRQTRLSSAGRRSDLRGHMACHALWMRTSVRGRRMLRACPKATRSSSPARASTTSKTSP
jgi:hypothetical protein